MVVKLAVQRKRASHMVWYRGPNLVVQLSSPPTWSRLRRVVARGSDQGGYMRLGDPPFFGGTFGHS